MNHAIAAPSIRPDDQVEAKTNPSPEGLTSLNIAPGRTVVMPGAVDAGAVERARQAMECIDLMTSRASTGLRPGSKFF